MKKIWQASKLILFTLISLNTTSLSAWYDPTGYWGHRCPNLYDIPSRGQYTVRAELMQLRPHLDNIKPNFAAIDRAINRRFPGSIAIFTNDERKRRFKWREGWKVGIGFACADCWEADLNWTHYQGKAFLSDFRAAETKWKVHLNMIDLEIGKEMWFRDMFRLKPYAGVRYAQIKQGYHFRVPGKFTNAALGGTFLPFDLHGRLYHNYLAGGPRIGVDFSWLVGCGFNFYITAAANYLWGEMQNRYKDNDFVVSGIDKDHHWEGTGITDFSCGLGWSDLWWGETRRLTFRFGYEHHFFIHENKLDNEGGVAKRRHKSWFVQGIGGSIILDF